MSIVIPGHGDGKYRRITVYSPYTGEPRTYHPPHTMVSVTNEKQTALMWEVTADDGTLPGREVFTLSVNNDTGAIIEVVQPKTEVAGEVLDLIEKAKAGRLHDE